MKTNQLLDKIQKLNLSMLEIGTGKNGRIINDDLIRVLGDHYAKRKYPYLAGQRHLALRRRMSPMKAYRFNHLKPEQQKEVMASPDWLMEEKINGWRMSITYVKGAGFRFWSGNISDVDFLPVDFTDKVIIEHYLHILDVLKKFSRIFGDEFLIDAEATCDSQPIQDNGLPATDTREGIAAILGSNAERALKLQREGHMIKINVLNMLCVSVPGYRDVSTNFAFDFVRTIKSLTGSNQFEYVRSVRVNKKSFLQKIFSEGGEGAVVKNLRKPYVPGARLKDHWVKIKRDMQQEVGHDVDCFIHSFYMTPEWTTKVLIGGVNLAVYLEGKEEPHIIASISSMPNWLRESMTHNQRYYQGKVVVVNGQELSSRNLKIMHATTDWNIRSDKTYLDCKLELPEEEF